MAVVVVVVVVVEAGLLKLRQVKTA